MGNKIKPTTNTITNNNPSETKSLKTSAPPPKTTITKFQEPKETETKDDK